MLVGGSALYTRAVLDAFSFPGTDPAVRARWNTALDEQGPEALHRRLAEVDPASAGVILPSNGRRIVRALEVNEITGRSFTATLPERRYAVAGAVQVGVAIDRPRLDERIAARVERMWDQGLVAEVRRLEAAGLREGLTASRALGYQQVLAFLAGTISEEQALEQTVVGTRRFARRQEGWFSKDDRVAWVRHDDPDRVAVALEVVRRRDGG